MKKIFTLLLIATCLLSGVALAQKDDTNTTYDANGHGSHYTLAEFDAEVNAAFDKWKASEEADGTKLSESNVVAGKTEIATKIYKQYNPSAPEAMLIKFRMNYASALKGMVTDKQLAGIAENDPRLKPIYGISLYDYATLVTKSGAGDFNKLLAVFKIDLPTWQKVNAEWPKRMKADTSYALMKLYAQYMGKADQNPKLAAFKPATSTKGAATLKRLDQEYFFAVELASATSVAAQNGADASAWILKEHGVTLAELMAKYAKHQQNRVSDSQNDQKLADTMAFFQKKYEAIFKK